MKVMVGAVQLKRQEWQECIESKIKGADECN